MEWMDRPAEVLLQSWTFRSRCSGTVSCRCGVVRCREQDYAGRCFEDCFLCYDEVVIGWILTG
jgi:hypothetical protein